MRVYVAFRAPIGVGYCNLDRFLLLRGWLPALNLVLIAFIPGIALLLIKQGDYAALFFPSHTITLLEGIREYLPESQIIYEPGCDLTSDVTLQSVFQQCSMDGKQGFSAKYWNNTKQEGTPDATNHISTPFHFITTEYGGTYKKGHTGYDDVLSDVHK